MDDVEKLRRKAVGARIKSLMDEKGISVKEIADALNITSGAVSQWRVGGSRISDDNLSKLAGYLGTTPEYILGGHGDDGGESLYPLSTLEKAIINACRENLPADNYTAAEKRLVDAARQCKSLSTAQLVEVVGWLSNASAKDLLTALSAFQNAAEQQQAVLLLEDN